VTVKKKRELFPGPALPSRDSVALPQNILNPRGGILTSFPFDRRWSLKVFLRAGGGGGWLGWVGLVCCYVKVLICLFSFFFFSFFFF
jgi:hypothetical protein